MLVRSHTTLWKVVTNPVRKREHLWRSKVERMTGQRLKNSHLVCRLTVVTQFGCLSLMMSHSNGYWKLVIFLSFSLLHDPQIPELLLNPLRSRPLSSMHWADHTILTNMFPSHCLTGHSILRLISRDTLCVCQIHGMCLAGEALKPQQPCRTIYSLLQESREFTKITIDKQKTILVCESKKIWIWIIIAVDIQHVTVTEIPLAVLFSTNQKKLKSVLQF